MNKNYRVLKINGFRGILLALFVVCCLVTGFAVFPGWIFMHLWNYTASFFIAMPKMDLVQGVILWAIVALSIYGLNSNRFFVGFSSPPPLDDEQIKSIMNRVKSAANNETTVDVSAKDENLDEIRK